LSEVARRIRVTGVVQGVGFRPFVWRLAQELGLTGWVRNDGQGVEIAAHGDAEGVTELLRRLRADAPLLARVDAVRALDSVNEGFRDFVIARSAPGEVTTPIGPDTGVCPDCLAELFNPADRRWRHAFITCTHCGPRYTVTWDLPYDRAQTSLAPFPLCVDCEREYRDPADRRFHAETTCCPRCGPRLSLVDLSGAPIPGEPIEQTLTLLQSGAIVAIKGLGGFHLACDARDADAVARLRQRKNRDEKPLAVMVANAASLAPYAIVDAPEQAELESAARPVVLLRALAGLDTALPGVSPGLGSLGVMLPSTPIHHLLFHEAAGRLMGDDWLSAPQDMVLVMTSANPGGEPIVRDGDEALARLSGIADAALDHDRVIVARCDDSVLRLHGDTPQFIRRSRGYAPTGLRLAKGGPSVLAFGAHLKNTVCLTRGMDAFLSPHVGDLDNAATVSFLNGTVDRLLGLLNVRPGVIVHDLHPDYLSTRAALDYAERHGLPTLAVQHHHAHIAAVCAEHGHVGPVLGLALDGVGLGSDGQPWGGELLRVDGAHFERLGHLRPLPLAGGDRAAQEPWRMAATVLHASGRQAEIGPRFSEWGGNTVAAMLGHGLNCPPTSSMGRVFDAAAGLLGLSTHQRFEAQAAMLLEQAATRHIEQLGWPKPMKDGWTLSPQGQLDFLPVLASLDSSDDPGTAAARFHATVVDGLAAWVRQAAQTSGLRTLAWGGGCFLNALLSRGLRQSLVSSDLAILAPERVSAGDASIALGQAWVALHSLET
jgi:hydrogenase maturation protein HypF